MPYIEKRIKSGKVLEIQRYYTPNKPRIRGRGKKSKLSTDKQLRANLIRTEKEAWRVINCNFSRENKDQFVTFTFAKAVDKKTAAKQWRNFIRRLRRWCTKQNTELKYLAALEKQSQWHIHAVINFCPLDELQRLWGCGRVQASILDDSNNFIDLARYLVGTIKVDEEHKEDFERAKFTRHWSGSHNLKRPEIEEKELKSVRLFWQKPTPPHGYTLTDYELTADDSGNLHQYIIFRQYAEKLPPTPKNNGLKISCHTRGYS